MLGLHQADQAMNPVLGGVTVRNRFEVVRELGEAAAGARSSQQGDLEETGGPGGGPPVKSEGGIGMSQQRHQLLRLGGGRGNREDQRRKHTLRRVRQCLAGRVGDGQIPPRQLGLDATGEAAVRCHQGGGAVRLVDGAAHDEGDGGRFQSLIGSSDQPHPGDAGGDPVAMFVDHLPPAVGGCGRPHGLAEHEAHDAAAAVRIDAGQELDGGPLDAQPLEQKLEAELGILRRKRCPGVFAKLLIEPRQHHRAIVEPGNRRHHAGGCRHRTGRAGGDRRRSGAACETLRLAIDDERAALVRADHAARRQQLRIAGPDMIEEIEHVALMIGHLAAEQLGQIVERYVLDVEGVDQLGEAGRQAQGIGGAGAVPGEAGLRVCAREGSDQLREQETALEFADGSWQVGAVEIAIAVDFVLVERAQYADPRQEPGAAGLAHEGVGQGRLGAARRQVDAPMRQRGGFGSRPARLGKAARENGSRQRVAEGHIGRHGEDAHGVSAARSRRRHGRSRLRYPALLRRHPPP